MPRPIRPSFLLPHGETPVRTTMTYETINVTIARASTSSPVGRVSLASLTNRLITENPTALAIMYSAPRKITALREYARPARCRPVVHSRGATEPVRSYRSPARRPAARYRPGCGPGGD